MSDLVPIAGAAVSAMGNVIGSSMGASSQKDANKANMELAKYQYDRAVEMWNAQNEYNLPQNQMARLSAAGLNPHLVYGNGQVQGLTSAPAPEYKAPHIQAYTNFGSLGLDQAVTTYQNLRASNAQIEKTKADTERVKALQPLIELDSRLKSLDILKREMDNTRDKKYLDVLDDRIKLEMEGLANDNRLKFNQAEETVSRMDLNDAKRDLTKAETLTELEKPALVRSQTSEHTAGARYKNAQARGQDITNKYLPQTLQTAIDEMLSRTYLNDKQCSKLTSEIGKLWKEGNILDLEYNLRNLFNQYGINPNNNSEMGTVLNLILHYKATHK